MKYLLQKRVKIDIVYEQIGTPLILESILEQWGIFNLLIEGGGKEKLGNKADTVIAIAAKLSKQSPIRGNLHKEIQLWKFIMEVTKISFGEEHPLYVHYLNVLVGFYSKLGNFEKALTLLEQALTITKKN